MSKTSTTRRPSEGRRGKARRRLLTGLSVVVFAAGVIGVVSQTGFEKRSAKSDPIANPVLNPSVTKMPEKQAAAIPERYSEGRSPDAAAKAANRQGKGGSPYEV